MPRLRVEIQPVPLSGNKKVDFLATSRPNVPDSNDPRIAQTLPATQNLTDISPALLKANPEVLRPFGCAPVRPWRWIDALVWLVFQSIWSSGWKRVSCLGVWRRKHWMMNSAKLGEIIEKMADPTPQTSLRPHGIGANMGSHHLNPVGATTRSIYEWWSMLCFLSSSGASPDACSPMCLRSGPVYTGMAAHSATAGRATSP